MDPQALYAQLGRLIESAPDLSNIHTAGFSPELHKWLGQAHALVNETGMITDAVAIVHAIPDLTHARDANRAKAQETILSAVYRALAVAELKAPAAAQEAFIPAQNAFDAHAAFGKVFGTATKDILVVDPYMDDKVLVEFAVLAAEGIAIRLLSDEKTFKPALPPAVSKWQAQHRTRRPLEAKLAPASTLHDRLVIVDQRNVWVLTQSTNAFAMRAPASIVRVDAETAALKVAAYEAVWAASRTP
jgi:hypothetical protein